MRYRLFSLGPLLLLLLLFACAQVEDTAVEGTQAGDPQVEGTQLGNAPTGSAHAVVTPLYPKGVLNAAFVCTPGVFNSELMAPYDVLQHTLYRDEENYIRTFVVSETGEPFVTAEGITVTPHYSFKDAPRIDILVVPSSEHSMGEDLDNEVYIGWLSEKIEDAQWVMSLCDGAFPLAATGALNGKICTTYPGDRDKLAQRFEGLDVRYDLRFVVDGKFITSTGGAPSYEPAFWLVAHLYGQAHADATGVGLVHPWEPSKVPHLVVGR